MPWWNCIAIFCFLPCQTKAGINTFNEGAIFLRNETKKATIVFPYNVTFPCLTLLYVYEITAPILWIILLSITGCAYWYSLTTQGASINYVITPLSPLNSSKTASSELPSALFSYLDSYQWNIKLGIRCYLMGNGLYEAPLIKNTAEQITLGHKGHSQGCQ